MKRKRKKKRRKENLPDCKTACASSLLVKPFNPAPASTSHATICDPERSKKEKEETEEGDIAKSKLDEYDITMMEKRRCISMLCNVQCDREVLKSA